MPAVRETVDQVRQIDVDQYKYGFVTDIASDTAPTGLSEDVVRFISAKRTSLTGCWSGGLAPIAAG
jgi:Fe-S cluster assembly protein SufB